MIACFGGEMTKIFHQKDFFAAVPLIKSGATVVYPTETVYGLGAALNNVESLKKVFKIKHRSFDKPLSLNIADATMARPFINEKDYLIYERIAKKFLPGPLSVIFKTNYCGATSSYFTHNHTISLRMPDNDYFLAILKKIGPLPGTSANLSGQLSLTQEETIISSMNNLADVILLNGEGKVGVESTILDLSNDPLIRRQGVISVSELTNFLQKEVKVLSDQRHYQLTKPLYIYQNYSELANLITVHSRENYFILGNNFDLPGNHLDLSSNPLSELFKIVKALNDNPEITVIFAQVTGNNLYSKKVEEMVNHEIGL